MTTISVVTAVYNRKDTVAQALDSVLAQTYASVEPVVIDGASTDGTVEVLGRYRSRIPVLVSEPDAGIYDALNKGILLSHGDVVGFLHADDLFAHDAVLERIAAAFENSGADAVYGDLVYVDKEDPNRIVRYWKAGGFNPTKLRQGWMPPHPTFYVKRSVYERLGLFDTRYRIAADYDSVVRFLLLGGIQVAYVPEVLVRMRVGGVSNRSLSTIVRKSREDHDILRRHGVGGLPTLLRKNLGKVGQFWTRK
jgi:glycosyltransferase involved in cell wall biosynthesis